jgi:DNA-binding CsgD family transcriptional regulator
MSLIERETELATLARLFRESLDGHGRLVVVGGGVASGKTALLRAFADQATTMGAIFLDATAKPAEHDVPLGVVGQIFHRFEPSHGTLEGVRRLLHKAVGSATFDEAELRPEVTSRVLPSVLQQLCGILLRKAAQTPLVIGIDDVQHADTASLQFVMYLAHRLKSARILLLLNENVGPCHAHPLFHADLLSQPDCRYIRLNPLSRSGQAELLASRFGAQAGHRLAPWCDAMTGGNPLLVQALIEDNRSHDGAELTVDTVFPQAMVACFRRGGPVMADVARVLAILGEPAGPTLVARLLDLNTEHVAHTVKAMNLAGLLDSGRFRHPAARTAVLDGMAPEERTELHDRAARLLHENGAAAAVVSAHLVAAGTGEPWTVPVLEDAAGQALAGDEPHIALSCLRLAHRACTDERRRTKIASALADTEWRIDPALADHLMPALVTAARDGRLDREDSITLLGRLMWRGQVTEAIDILRALSCPTAARPYGPARDLEAARLLMSCVYPGAMDRAGVDWTAEEDRRKVAAAANRQLRSTAVLSAVLTGQPDYDVSGTAEQVLQGSRLGETPPGAVLAALAALVYDDQPEKAAHWCDPLLEEAASQRIPIVHAALGAAHALIRLRQGDLVAAEDHARAALSRISPAGWGVAIGMPISVMVLATTAMGRHEDAATYLGVTVPDAMFQTPSGLHYLRARGHHCLATGRPSAAVADFRTCGDLMREWGFDIPGLLTWRTDVALALIDLGETREARRLAEEQLAMLRPGPSRTRGVSLRVQALATDLCHRRPLLDQAVEVLERSSDQHELMLALHDLGEVQRATGEHDQAAASIRSARLAGRYEPLPPETPSAEEEAALLAADLTEAERKVTVLAAQGHTNRQIADTFLITISTVEQHLTRVYRKLRVNRRTDLPKLPARDEGDR